MKAAELLKRYEAGQRDFRGENLRGQNFKGKHLAEADFSGADIRSTNFTNANLTRANFIQAKAGLQRRWAMGLVVGSFLMSALSGLFSAITGLLMSLVFDASSLENQVLGWVAIAVLVVFCIIIIRKGLVAGAVAVAVTFTIAVAVAFSGVGAGAFAVAFSGVGAVTVAVAGAVTFAFALAVAGTFAFVFAATVAVAGSVTFAFSGAGAGAVTIAVVVTVAVALLSAYLGWRAWRGDPKDAWIRSIAVAFAAIGGTSFRRATLTDADFSRAQLKSTDLRRAVLIRTCWREAEKLDQVRPGETYLNTLKIQTLLLTGDGQGQSFDYLLNLQGINLQGANLVKADFTGSNLKDGNLQGAKLANASFIGANLNGAYLQDADLSDTKLVQAQLDQADLTGATLTGAYIEDWGITTRTILNGIRCDYIFMRLPSESASNRNPRRKPDDWDKTFADGEFVDFIAPLVETLDLYHNQAVDPRAVAISFHDLRKQNPEAELDIVSLEKRGKHRDKLLLRAEASTQAELSALHSQYFERYKYLLTLPPQVLQALLIEKDQEVRRLARLVDTAIERPTQTFVNQYHNQGDITVSEQGSNSPKYDLSNAQFAGGFAETVQGDQIGGTINNYGANLDDINSLITSLRELAQSFPTEQKDDVLMELDDIETDIQQPQPDQKRIGRRLKRLAAIATTAAAITGGAATFSGDLNAFAGNLIELTEKLGITVEQIQTDQVPPASAP